MDLYSIPPILSSIILFILFLMGLFKSRGSRTNLLFAFICLLGCLLNMDKAILTIVERGDTAIRISRVDHAFLVFIIPLYLHFTIMVTGQKRWLTVVKILYFVSFCLIPLTQHRLYLTGVQRFFFGFFAISGPLFYVFGLFSAISLFLSLFLLFKGLKEEKSSIKKTRIKYIILSFGLAAFVNHFDVIVMKGIEIYPIGNFVFIPMSLLGYAIFKHDVMEWKIFLNRGIIFTVLFLVSIGFFIGVASLIKGLLGGAVGQEIPYITAMVLTFLLIYLAKERFQAFFIHLLQQGFIKNQKAIKELSYEILSLFDIEEIKERIKKRLYDMFSLEHCDIKMVPRSQDEPFYFLNEKEEMWARGFRLAIGIPSKEYPSLILLGEKKDLSLFTEGEIEMLTILANHTALAFDNAHAYRKLQEFSSTLERVVEERTKALIQSESLAAVGRLAAGVAHEMNNPIAGVMSTLEYHIDHLEGKEELKEDLIFSLNELKRVRDIVRSLLDAARQKESMDSLVDIHGPIDDTLRILAPQLKKSGVTVEKSYNAKKSIITGDASRLCQVFINIIKNGIDSLGEGGGKILIQTENPSAEKVICSIKDNGSGIKKEIIKDIFKPFFTTKEQGKGMGLGLFIAHEIIKRHGGDIGVESKEGEGTTFTLSFPCHS
ncbi:MAG: ATP-binding protein [Syntrophorhabdaceae bacterium]|nr:ATP-binding protein [Syntrophorhabdaceae bacterium]